MNLTERPLYNRYLEAPARDELYLAYVRSFPCVVHGCRRKAEAAHIGPHGVAQKASDYSTAPICEHHHRTSPSSLHNIGLLAFERLHGVHLMDVVRRLRRKPRIRVEAGRYVALIDGHDHVLRPVQDGLKFAVQSAMLICRATRVVTS